MKSSILLVGDHNRMVHNSMDESIQDFSCIQDFEAIYKVSLKMLNSAENTSFSDLVSDNLNLI